MSESYGLGVKKKKKTQFKEQRDTSTALGCVGSLARRLPKMVCSQEVLPLVVNARSFLDFEELCASSKSPTFFRDVRFSR